MSVVTVSIGLIVAGIAAFWGNLSAMIQILVVLMAFDILTGLLDAFVTKQVSSNVSFVGMAKKAMVLLVVGLGVYVEGVIGQPIGQAVAGFYAAHEAISILENCASAGLPVPDILRDALARITRQPPRVPPGPPPEPKPEPPPRVPPGPPPPPKEG